MNQCQATNVPFSARPDLIGARIKHYRMSREMSMNDLQECMPGRLALQTLYKWEKGVCLPGLDNLGNLSRILRVSLDELVFGRENEYVS